MGARLSVVVLLALAAVAVLVSCGGGSSGGEQSARGVIVDVRSSTLREIDSFTLRTNDGRTLRFLPAPDAAKDPAVGLLGGHLRTHAVLGDQVEVFYREAGGELLALRIEDRPALG
jgi:hypothetical protein